MYCFLHSGVICADKCSANFIVKCTPNCHNKHSAHKQSAISRGYKPTTRAVFVTTTSTGTNQSSIILNEV